MIVCVCVCVRTLRWMKRHNTEPYSLISEGLTILRSTLMQSGVKEVGSNCSGVMFCGRETREIIIISRVVFLKIKVDSRCISVY